MKAWWLTHVTEKFHVCIIAFDNSLPGSQVPVI